MDNYLASLLTEQVNSRTKEIDRCDTAGILELINAEDRIVPEAVGKEIPQIARAVDLIVSAIRDGGRLFYFGAGTSGRLGVLDASECTPTFGVSHDLIQGHIAGGDTALRNAVEDSEDSEDLGRDEIGRLGITAADVVTGIAASGRTPYVLGVVRQAAAVGAKTIGITTNPDSILQREVDVCIAPLTGPEALTGSTRMKSGTAQKLVLNMLTTATMIKLGKAYGNRMVDLNATNGKLVDRARRIFRDITGGSEEDAQKYLAAANMRTKLAILMYLSGLEAADAQAALDENADNLRQALSRLGIEAPAAASSVQ